MATGMKITGGRKLTAMLNEIGAKGGPVAEKALYAAGQKILTKAVEYTPREFGPLRGSGNVTLPSGGVVHIQFGGPAAPYAFIVHEGPNKNWTVPGTGNKFLERAATQYKGVAFKTVHAAVRSMMQGAG